MSLSKYYFQGVLNSWLRPCVKDTSYTQNLVETNAEKMHSSQVHLLSMYLPHTQTHTICVPVPDGASVCLQQCETSALCLCVNVIIRKQFSSFHTFKGF